MNIRKLSLLFCASAGFQGLILLLTRLLFVWREHGHHDPFTAFFAIGPMVLTYLTMLSGNAVANFLGFTSQGLWQLIVAFAVASVFWTCMAAIMLFGFDRQKAKAKEPKPPEPTR